MIKICRFCGNLFDGPPKKKYCRPQCKKNYENSLRRPPEMLNVAGSPPDPAPKGTTFIIGGRQNFISAASFAELREMHSRLRGIGKAIDESRKLIEDLVVGAVTADGGVPSEGGGGRFKIEGEVDGE